MNHKPIFALLIAIVVGGSAYVAAQDPKSAAEFVRQGFEAAKAGQHDRSIEFFERAIQIDPNSSEAHRQLGVAYGILKRTQKAQIYLEKAVQLDPNNPYAYLSLGNNLTRLGRFDEALAAFSEGKRLRPGDAIMDTALGNAYYNINRFDEALAHYLRASERMPNHPGYAYNVGLTYARLGKTAEAVAPLENAVRLQPDLKNAWFHLGHAYSSVRRFKESAEAWGKLSQIDPGNSDILSKQAWNLRYGEYDKQAIDAAELYLKRFGWKTNSSAFQALVAAISYRTLGMDDEADSVIERALKNCDSNVWSYSLLRFWSRQMSAEDLLVLATNIDKKTEAHTYIGVLKRLNGDPVGARDHFEWVKEFGNRQFYEFPLALLELERIKK